MLIFDGDQVLVTISTPGMLHSLAPAHGHPSLWPRASVSTPAHSRRRPGAPSAISSRGHCRRSIPRPDLPGSHPWPAPRAAAQLGWRAPAARLLQPEAYRIRPWGHRRPAQPAGAGRRRHRTGRSRPPRNPGRSRGALTLSQSAPARRAAAQHWPATSEERRGPALPVHARQAAAPRRLRGESRPAPLTSTWTLPPHGPQSRLHDGPRQASHGIGGRDVHVERRRRQGPRRLAQPPDPRPDELQHRGTPPTPVSHRRWLWRPRPPRSAGVEENGPTAALIESRTGFLRPSLAAVRREKAPAEVRRLAFQGRPSRSRGDDTGGQSLY